MESVDRRTFLGTTAGVAAAMSATREVRAAVGSPPPPPMVPLGKTGIQLSRLAQGTGVHGGNRQSDQTRLGFEKLVGLFEHAYDRGVRFFDLADLYGTHLYFREALRTIPREEVAILTKVWWPYDGPRDESQDPSRADSARATLERFRHELSTDYLDIVLLHCMQSADWNVRLARYMDVLSEAKEKQTVRAVGVSCHDYGALVTAAESPWVDVILARLNPRGVLMDGTPEQIIELLRKARQNGKAIIGMKIFGEGKLSGEREECIRFAQEVGVMDAMTIGFEKKEQIDEVLHLLAKYPAKALG